MTRAQRLEAALRTAEQRLEALLDSETAGITSETGAEIEQVLTVISRATQRPLKGGAA
jgi:hypothetical protein